jgi:hypothetical protein
LSIQEGRPVRAEKEKRKNIKLKNKKKIKKNNESKMKR